MRYGLKFKNKKFQKGFTLVELLIVVAIIGVLATLLMVNFIAVRQRARDAERKSDIRQIQSALELFRSDEGLYPNASPPTTTLYNGASCPDSSALAVLDPTTQNKNTYMAKIPCDPNGIGYYNAGEYFYSGGGSTYTLGACLENTADTQQGTTGTSPGGSGCSSGWYFVVTQP